MATDIKNKHIVIVGASSGLGKALATQLAHEQANVYMLSRTIELIETDYKAIKVNCDVRNAKSITNAFTKIDSHTDQIDIVINCAGIGLIKNLEDTSDEGIEDILKTNLFGAIVASREGYKRMITKQSGHIINITSTSSAKARPDETVYCASKAGLRLFTESLRLAAVKNKIRVTVVAPGGMNTPFWEGIEPRNVAAFMDPSEIAEQIIHLINSSSSISPSEIVIERGV